VNHTFVGRTILISLAFVVVATAQQLPFQLVLNQGKGNVLIQNGSTVTLSAPIGQTQTAQVNVTYTGTGQATISSPPSIFGSSDFTAAIKGSLPITLNQGSAISFTVTFTATSGTQSSGQVSLPFVETPTPSSSTAPAPVQNAITLALQGTAPSFVLNYVLPADGNVIPVPSGGTIVLPPTPISTISRATLNVTNTGSGPGVITGISITGAAFRLSQLPLFPVTVAAGQSLQVLILYQPTLVASDAGQVEITFDTGPPARVNLQGNGTSSTLVYQSLQTNPPTNLAPGGTLAFPGTNVGQSSSIPVRIINSGNADGIVSSINIAGQGFQLSNVPQLPQTLAPNASLAFTVTFTPAQPAALKGSLFINSDTVNLSGVGLGSQLAISYTAAGTTITLVPGGNNSVVFSPVMISQSSQVSLDVKNTGTVPAVISNIGVTQVNGPFSLSGVPPLPISLGPNEDFHLLINFTPTTLGFSSGSLLIDTTTVTLVGSGTQPPPLPGYSIAGPTGTVPAGTQPSFSLTLATPYPVPISGTLTLSVSPSSDLPADAAVQFATGGQTVPFVIPANTTSAVFAKQGTQIGLQTGTVAGTITLTPSFATLAGNVDLTPASPTTLQITVAPASPTLTTVQLSNQTANSVTLVVSGFTPTRKLTSANVQFTTAPGINMPTSTFTIDLQQIATVWFRSSASQAFGGQFSISIPFTFQGTLPAGQTVLSGLASVSVVMSNDVGSSNSIQTKIQ
jgi:hypothetical protein